MRQFWGNQYDFNDRNDFPARQPVHGRRPPTRGRRRPAARSRSATSTPTGADIYGARRRCSRRSPTRRRGAAGQPVRDRDHAEALLLRELGAVPRERPGVPARRGARSRTQQLQLPDADHGAVLVAAGDGRGRDRRRTRRTARCRSASRGATSSARRCRTGWASADLCALAVPLPSIGADDDRDDRAAAWRPTRSAAAREIPVTPSDPTLFYRAASELLCENIAAQVVDPTSGDERLLEQRRAGRDREHGRDGRWATRRATRRTPRRCRSCRSTTTARARRRRPPTRQPTATTSATNALRSTFVAGLRVTHRRRHRPLKENRQ